MRLFLSAVFFVYLSFFLSLVNDVTKSHGHAFAIILYAIVLGAFFCGCVYNLKKYFKQ